jgi:Bacterial archaeo-eukaryotic release factor family 3
MERALLAELQGHRSYPSVTILLNTGNGLTLQEAHLTAAAGFISDADARLKADTPDPDRIAIVQALKDLLHQHAVLPATHALAMFASPEFTGLVRLGQTVIERLIIDETFATRDLVADLNRTALYRVMTISEGTVRLFIGDRQRLVEERASPWPLTRPPETSAAHWSGILTAALRTEQEQLPLPTVIAGADRPVRKVLADQLFDTIGVLPGNHDRTSWRDLHHLAWPLVSDWLRTDRVRAVAQLESARSQRKYAGGVDEIWMLANERRVELLIVEESFAIAAILTESHLIRTEDAEAPGVVDDVVDELIELVLQHGGKVVIAADGELVDHGRIAAILRY